MFPSASTGRRACLACSRPLLRMRALSLNRGPYNPFPVHLRTSVSLAQPGVWPPPDCRGRIQGTDGPNSSTLHAERHRAGLGNDRESLADGVEHGVDERQEAEREEGQERGGHAVSLSPEDDESQSLVVRSRRIWQSPSSITSRAIGALDGDAVGAASATRCRYVLLEGVQWVAGTSPPDPVPLSTYEDAMTDRQTVSIRKAFELVGVSRRTITNWMASGKVEYVRTAGGSVRIFVDTLWRTPADPTIARRGPRRSRRGSAPDRGSPAATPGSGTGHPRAAA